MSSGLQNIVAGIDLNGVLKHVDISVILEKLDLASITTAENVTTIVRKILKNVDLTPMVGNLDVAVMLGEIFGGLSAKSKTFVVTTASETIIHFQKPENKTGSTSETVVAAVKMVASKLDDKSGSEALKKKILAELLKGFSKENIAASRSKDTTGAVQNDEGGLSMTTVIIIIVVTCAVLILVGGIIFYKMRSGKNDDKDEEEKEESQANMEEV